MVKFQQRMRSAALEIYKDVFPGCELVDLRGNGTGAHMLDNEFAVGSLIKFPSGQWISLQEKFKNYTALTNYFEFTQEYKNAHGTPSETPGEWFHLGAQLLFYGWANRDETGFGKWVLLNILKCKMLILERGGMDKAGRMRKNKAHGGASYYVIPLYILIPAIIADDQGGLKSLSDPSREVQRVPINQDASIFNDKPGLDLAPK